MTAPKTFGQIAYEAHETARGVTTFPWGALHALEHEFWEDIGASVALECSRICTEIAAEHMRQAQGGDNTGASDHRQQAALECAEAIREAITK